VRNRRFPGGSHSLLGFEITPEGIKRSEDVLPDDVTGRKTVRKLVGITVALAIVAAGLLAFQIFRPRLMTDSPPAAAVPLPVAAAQVIPENRSQ
jgi:4-hydroxybenzoate polyprenyltransferase